MRFFNLNLNPNLHFTFVEINVNVNINVKDWGECQRLTLTSIPIYILYLKKSKLKVWGIFWKIFAEENGWSRFGKRRWSVLELDLCHGTVRRPPTTLSTTTSSRSVVGVKDDPDDGSGTIRTKFIKCYHSPLYGEILISACFSRESMYKILFLIMNNRIRHG